MAPLGTGHSPLRTPIVSPLQSSQVFATRRRQIPAAPGQGAITNDLPQVQRLAETPGRIATFCGGGPSSRSPSLSKTVGFACAPGDDGADLLLSLRHSSTDIFFASA